MLLKLLKYDIKSTYIRILATFAIYLIVAVAVPLLLLAFQPIGAMIYAVLAIPLAMSALFILTFIVCNMGLKPSALAETFR